MSRLAPLLLGALCACAASHGTTGDADAGSIDSGSPDAIFTEASPGCRPVTCHSFTRECCDAEPVEACDICPSDLLPTSECAAFCGTTTCSTAIRELGFEFPVYREGAEVQVMARDADVLLIGDPRTDEAFPFRHGGLATDEPSFAPGSTVFAESRNEGGVALYQVSSLTNLFIVAARSAFGLPVDFVLEDVRLARGAPVCSTSDESASYELVANERTLSPGETAILDRDTALVHGGLVHFSSGFASGDLSIAVRSQRYTR